MSLNFRSLDPCSLPLQLHFLQYRLIFDLILRLPIFFVVVNYLGKVELIKVVVAHFLEVVDPLDGLDPFGQRLNQRQVPLSALHSQFLHLPQHWLERFLEFHDDV